MNKHLKRYLMPFVVLALVVPVAMMCTACGGGDGGSKPLTGQYKLDAVTLKDVTFIAKDIKTCPDHASIADCGLAACTKGGFTKSGESKMLKVVSNLDLTDSDDEMLLVIGIVIIIGAFEAPEEHALEIRAGEIADEYIAESESGNEVMTLVGNKLIDGEENEMTWNKSKGTLTSSIESKGYSIGITLKRFAGNTVPPVEE